jgi:hypothetical protein
VLLPPSRRTRAAGRLSEPSAGSIASAAGVSTPVKTRHRKQFRQLKSEAGQGRLRLVDVRQRPRRTRLREGGSGWPSMHRSRGSTHLAEVARVRPSRDETRGTLLSARQPARLLSPLLLPSHTNVDLPPPCMGRRDAAVGRCPSCRGRSLCLALGRRTQPRGRRARRSVPLDSDARSICHHPPPTLPFADIVLAMLLAAIAAKLGQSLRPSAPGGGGSSASPNAGGAPRPARNDFDGEFTHDIEVNDLRNRCVHAFRPRLWS